MLICHAVMSARQFIRKPVKSSAPAIGQWIVAEAPARIDFAGFYFIFEFVLKQKKYLLYQSYVY